jgi:hypothetical protein
LFLDEHALARNVCDDDAHAHAGGTSLGQRGVLCVRERRNDAERDGTIEYANR